MVSHAHSLGPFRIDEDTGELILTSPLDYETTMGYMININATNDGGGVVFYDMSVVSITVIDVNDRSPIFSQPDYSATINEGLYTATNEALNIQVTLLLDHTH